MSISAEASVVNTEEVQLERQGIREYLPTLMSNIKLPLPIFRKTIELDADVVYASARQFEVHEFPILRNEFTKCDNLWNFLDFQEEHIPYIKSRLDFVESIAFLSKWNGSSLYKPMFLAFKTRIKYYNERFVAKFAKHTGTPEQKNSENYLRTLKIKKYKKQFNQLQQQILSEMDIRIAGNKKNPVYILCEKKIENEQFNDLITKLNRAILGKIIKDELIELSQSGTSVTVYELRMNSDERTESVEKDIHITEGLICFIPETIRALHNARRLESIAFTSCFGINDFNKSEESHVHELEFVEKLANIDFDTDPTFFQMKINEFKKMLKKYLKYKTKYLNLKNNLIYNNQIN
jgi:hypothetical protein